MVELLAKTPGSGAASVAMDAPPLAPSDGAIDRAHLARMTQGERALEREVLALFATQTEVLIGRMRAAPPPQIGALAHTLCGSARGIGAWTVAAAAERLEAEAAAGRPCTPALERLAEAARQARIAAAELMRA